MKHIKTIFQDALDAKYDLQKQLQNLAIEKMQAGDSELGDTIQAFSDKIGTITAPFTGEDGALHIIEMFDLAIERKNNLQKEIMALTMSLMQQGNTELGNKLYEAHNNLSTITAPFVGEGE